MPVFARIFEDARNGGLSRRDMLIKMQKTLPQAYVPAFYEVKYSADSMIREIKAVVPDLPERIRIHQIKEPP